nr:hypothetical protein [Moritella viscosa]
MIINQYALLANNEIQKVSEYSTWSKEDKEKLIADMPAILTKAKTYLGAGMEHGRTKEINAQEVQIKRLDQQLIELTKAVSDSKNKKSWW